MNALPALVDPGLFELLCNHLKRGEQLYMVGGGVRDWLLRQTSHDLDFVTNGDVRSLARNVANELNGHFYMLDDDRNTARVIYYPGHQDRLILDFAMMRGNNLEDDLSARDFTINAIALDIRDPQKLIDPLGGAQHLKDKVLCPCSPQSFRDDPIRVMRAVRFATQLKLKVAKETLSLMQEAAALLPQVSAERQRDELFRILEGNRVSTAVRLLDKVSALNKVLPELTALKRIVQPPPHTLDVWEHTLAVVQALENLFDVLVGEYQEEASNLTMGTAVLRLGHFRRKLAEHFAQRMVPERNRRGLLHFAALYHDVGKPAAVSDNNNGRRHFYRHERYSQNTIIERGKALALSAQEWEYLALVTYKHMYIHHLAENGSPPTRRAIFRYFRATGEAGVDICLLSLADLLGTYQATLSQDIWLTELDICRTLFESWWEKKEEIIVPARLLNGEELMEALSLQPGPLVGRLLKEIQEAQAAGEIFDRQQALEFARKRLVDYNERA